MASPGQESQRVPVPRMAAETGQRGTGKEHGRKPNTDGFAVSEVETQFLFPFDIDVSTLGHILGIA